MKQKEKDDVMSRFKDNELKLLVSTTVIEVGVDVPNSVVMVIENAEQFGLSQLHQLRGRVGRGKEQSHCILITDSKSEYTKARIYRNSGIITLILNLALSSAIAQMIFSNAHFSYFGWTIFAYAAYAFYKITVAIISFIKAHKQTDLTIRAIRNINLADALVSILALQTALLTMFSEGEVDISLFNTLTGIVVSLSTIAIGIYMIVSATNKIKEIQKEKIHNEQSV